MKKIILSIIISLFLVSVVSAEWDGNFNNVYKRNSVQTQGIIDVSNNVYANFTCGTNNDALSYQDPVFKDITDEDVVETTLPKGELVNVSTLESDI